jgi:hypothetical protein
MAHNELKEKTAVFVGCARDIEQYIERTIGNLMRLRSYFKDYKIVIIENDSKDNTLSLLSKLKETAAPKVQVFTLSGVDAVYPLRTERMAYLRGVLKSKVDPQFDYVIVADLDNATLHVDDAGFLSNFDKSFEWDAVFPVTENVWLYDRFAFRHEDLNYNCFEAVEYFETLMTKAIPGVNKRRLKLFLMECFVNYHPTYVNVLSQLRAGSVVEVDSSFGGMGIYKSDVYLRGTYSGKSEQHFHSTKSLPDVNLQNSEDCEHVLFHNSIRRKVSTLRLVINPRFVVGEFKNNK